MKDAMSTIERAAARLGSIARRSDSAVAPADANETLVSIERAKPDGGGIEPTQTRLDSIAPPSTSPVFGEPRTVVLDLEELTARGFATPGNAQTPLATEFRRVKRPLLLKVKGATGAADESNPPNLIMVTSSLPHEGKTFVAANLAMSIAAEVDLSVVLVDADVTKGDITRVLGLENAYGLSDVLQRGADYVEEAIAKTNLEHLSLLSAGRPNPSIDELFASGVMVEITRQLALRDPNRIIVFDAAPLLAATEASVLARLMGQIVLVVEADKTPQAQVKDAIDHLEGCQGVSVLLNKVSRRPSESYYYYGYGGGGSA
jgi:exopolysaccharide/PEP-CTERM locus tyrosine autokinase